MAALVLDYKGGPVAGLVIESSELPVCEMVYPVALKLRVDEWRTNPGQKQHVFGRSLG